MLAKNKAYRIDCMKGLNKIKDGSVDMVLCDLPYGVTANSWDKIIPMNDYVVVGGRRLNAEQYFLYCFSRGLDVEAAHDSWDIHRKRGLWYHYKRVTKEKGVIVLTACQPFTTKLINSNFGMFRYVWIWQKSIKTNFFHAKKMPLREHEEIVVFYNKPPTYNPEGLKDCSIKNSSVGLKSVNYNFVQKKAYVQTKKGYPSSVLKIANPNQDNFHPTQKPLELGRYLVRTYSNKGDLVLDNACGSGTFLVAAKVEGRDFIGFETDKVYFKKLQSRLREVV